MHCGGVCYTVGEWRSESCLHVIMNAGFKSEVSSGSPPPLRFLDCTLLIDSVWGKAPLGGFDLRTGMCKSVPSEGHGSLPGVLSLDRAGDDPFCNPVVGLDMGCPHSGVPC